MYPATLARISIVMFGSLFSFCQSPKFHIEPQFDEARPFCQGIAAVRNGDHWGFIDTAGHWVLQPQFASALLREGAYWVEDQAATTLKMTQAPETGAWQALPYQTPAATVKTSVGLRLIFSKGQNVGISDAQGRIIAPPEFHSIEYLGGDLFSALLPGKGACLLHADGDILTDYFQEINPAIQHGRIRFRDMDRYGLLGLDGQVLLPATFWRLEVVGRHIACSEGGSLQLCSDRLEKLNELRFDEVVYLDEQHWLAKIRDTGEATLFDADGQVIKQGLVMSDGRLVAGLFPAQDLKAKQWGYLNSRGEMAIPFSFAYTESFWPNGKAVVWKTTPEGGNWKGLIDTSGAMVLEAELNDITWHTDGVYTTLKNGKTQLLDEQFRPLSKATDKPMEYLGHGVYALYTAKSNLEFRKSNWYTGEKGGLHMSREAKVSGIYTLDGALLVEELGENEEAPQVREGFVAAKRGGKWGFVRCEKITGQF